MHYLIEKEYKKLPLKEKKRYPYISSIGNKEFVAETYYFKTKKDRMKMDKDLSKSGIPLGKDWTEKERENYKTGNKKNYLSKFKI